MSFINMMANDVWSEADILKKTESMIRTYYSEEEETILNRKMTGVITGNYQLTAKEAAEIQDFSVKIMESRQANIEATRDMLLLLRVLDTEKSFLRLRLPIPEEVIEEEIVTNQAEIDIDLQERNAAEEVVASASEEVMKGVMLRNPEQ